MHGTDALGRALPSRNKSIRRHAPDRYHAPKTLTALRPELNNQHKVLIGQNKRNHNKEVKHMKKLAAFLLILALVMSLSCVACADALPASEPDETNMFGVDKNINMETLDQYLGRDDV